MHGAMLSPTILLGAPIECYYFGMTYAYELLSYFMSYGLMAKMFYPILHDLKISSVYEVGRHLQELVVHNCKDKNVGERVDKFIIGGFFLND